MTTAIASRATHLSPRISVPCRTCSKPGRLYRLRKHNGRQIACQHPGSGPGLSIPAFPRRSARPGRGGVRLQRDAVCRDRQVREDPRAVVPNMTRPRSGNPAGAFSVPASRQRRTQTETINSPCASGPTGPLSKSGSVTRAPRQHLLPAPLTSDPPCEESNDVGTADDDVRGTDRHHQSTDCDIGVDPTRWSLRRCRRRERRASTPGHDREATRSGDG